ncbi:hypothetical protein A3Q56_02165 [Intoshia linei]|uniref:Vacuolar ATPase assembly protein VMA22 n=1 Tax=Intoshia linei TaxID=1819745 RepID=A0A177B748_9BILA|nr:hypothetical protein A3Q56_02165 [Intoshia linei]
MTENNLKHLSELLIEINELRNNLDDFLKEGFLYLTLSKKKTKNEIGEMMYPEEMLSVWNIFEEYNEKPLAETIKSEKPSGKRNKKIFQTNPVNWFGVLIPETLRHCQTIFKNGVIQTIILLANKYLEMEQVMNLIDGAETEKLFPKK